MHGGNVEGGLVQDKTASLRQAASRKQDKPRLIPPRHNPPMRLFVGIPLAAEAIGELSAISARLRSSGDGLRWTTRETWHITLQFLGNTGPGQCEQLVAELNKVHSPAVPVKLEGLGIFDRSGVFFAGVKVTPALVLLRQQVAAATELCGFVSETRPYHPHITLARAKGQGRAPGMSELKSKADPRTRFTPFVAAEFFLYESFLGPAGSRYEIRERFSLDVHRTEANSPSRVSHTTRRV
jgi:2'-5' RNA ligase